MANINETRLVSVVALIQFIIAIVYGGFVATPAILSVTVLFVAYMAAMSMRNIVSVSISSMVPSQHERAAFTSLNQSISHFAAGSGAIISSYYLTSTPTGSLVGMDSLGIAAIVLSLFMPLCVIYLNRFIQQQKTKASPAPG